MKKCISKLEINGLRKKNSRERKRGYQIEEGGYSSMNSEILKSISEHITEQYGNIFNKELNNDRLPFIAQCLFSRGSIWKANSFAKIRKLPTMQAIVKYIYLKPTTKKREK